MNRNFDMQELINVVGNSAINVENLSNTVAVLSNNVSLILDEQAKASKRVAMIETVVTDVKRDIVDIKENEEITFSQQQAIQAAVHRRVYSLLGVPVEKADRTMDDLVAVSKYSHLFHGRCYREVMGMGHLRQPYRTTPKKSFKDAMDDIEVWLPRGGVQALKDEADRDALAKRIAQGCNP